MAEWFYAVKNERQGPVPVERLQELAKDGTISGSTRVWREGLSDWQPLSELGNEVFTTQTAECVHSGRIYPKSEMLQYGDVWVAPEFKDAYLQQVMESGGPVAGDKDWDQGMRFVGFWWRFLALFVDGLVLFIPNLIIMIPYMMASSRATSADPGNPLAQYSGEVLILYIVTQLAVNGLRLGYEVWMVGKFQATVGKMAIGAVVVTPDGGRVTYGRSFLRWLGKFVINNIIIYTIGLIPIGIFVAMNFQELSSGSMDPANIGMQLVIYGSLAMLMFLIGSFPFYMAGFAAQKQALHDMMFGTRVVRKTPENGNH